MRVNVLTVVKDDLEGMKRTSESVVQQKIPVHWIVVTPRGDLHLNKYIKNQRIAGIVKAVIEDEGLGVYPAMNQAIKLCDKEDWIWFLNAGDTFADCDSYAKAVNAIEKTTHSWVFGGHLLGSDSGGILAEIPAPKKFKPSNQLFSRKYISHQSAIFNAQFLERLKGFNPHYKIAADWDLMVRAWQICEGESIDAILSVFYMGGLSTSNRQKGNQELLEIRNVQLQKSYIFKNYWWYFYRSGRNYIVRKFEIINPEMANSIRKFRFFINKKLQRN
jgi:GT2 family glycosyltransferase